MAYLSIFVACHENHMELHLLTSQDDYCIFILQREEVFGTRDREKMNDEPWNHLVSPCWNLVWNFIWNKASAESILVCLKFICAYLGYLNISLWLGIELSWHYKGSCCELTCEQIYIQIQRKILVGVIYKLFKSLWILTTVFCLSQRQNLHLRFFCTCFQQDLNVPLMFPSLFFEIVI